MPVIGKNILENLTTGMYYDSKVIYREYIQNACDQIDKAEELGILEKGSGTVDVEIDASNRWIKVTDNATGISEAQFKSQLGDIANSDKIRGKDKGFRGIGRLCGLAYCKTLTFTTTYKGEESMSIMKIDAKKMREMLNSTVKYSIDEILNAIVKYEKKSACSDEHYFVVMMEDINPENTELLNTESVREYLSFVAPVPFNNKFTFANKIHKYADERNCHIDEYRIYICGSQIFKEYGKRLYEKEGSNGFKKPYDEIVDVAFHEFKRGSELIAWMWYGLCQFSRAIPKKENPMYGFRVRQSNIQIGDNAILAPFFKEDRGNSYFVGEVYIVSKGLTPNSQRDNFNETSERSFYECEMKKFCHDKLHSMYYMASDIKKSYKRLTEYNALVDSYEEKKTTGFVNQEEKIELEAKLVTATKEKDKAKERIAKLTHTDTLSDDPFAIVQQAITSHFEHNDTSKKTIEAEHKHVALGGTENHSKYFTDSLSKLDKNKRKLIAQIMGIVSKHTSTDVFDAIKADIEKEFR